MPRPREEMQQHFGDASVRDKPISAARFAAKDSPIATMIIQEHVFKQYSHSSNEVQFPWLALPEIPSTVEILSDRIMNGDDDIEYSGVYQARTARRISNLPENIIDSPWENKEEYISTHYQLLREDGTRPLRRAVEMFRDRPKAVDSGDLCIYTQVFIIGHTMATQGVAARIEFSHERSTKRIKWNQSKRLQQGTIVALSPSKDLFNSICKVAVVAARPLSGVAQNPPQIDLYWGDESDAVFDSGEEYVMIEAKSGYFEAYRHMLVAMQKLMTESFSMSEYLSDLKKEMKNARHIESQPLTNLSALVPRNTPVDDTTDLNSNNSHFTESLSNVNILKTWPVIPGSLLDESQMRAVKQVLAQRLAIVQGPPGTGKTFVSVSALKVMLENWFVGDPPIIIAAQTNHAIDQLLTILCHDDSDFHDKFIRLGGRSREENEIIRQQTMYEVKEKDRQQRGGKDISSSFRNCKTALKAAADLVIVVMQRALNQSADEDRILLEEELISQDQYDSLHDDEWVCATDVALPPGALAFWLGADQIRPALRTATTNFGLENGQELDEDFEEIEELEAENMQKDDEEMDVLRGVYKSTREFFTGRSTPGMNERKVKKLLKKKSNLWEIEQQYRGEVYRYLRKKLQDKLVVSLREQIAQYNRAAKNLKVARWDSESSLVRRIGIKLIGCTTTGLSKYRGLLASLQPKTLLIEEAAETLEGTVLAAQFESLEQLILVGDHQQLQANCNISELAKAPFNLAVSMFERLVSNGIHFTMLNKQRRMIPEIRGLLDVVYPDLNDHPSVLDRSHNRQPIPGMGGRDSYWFHHKYGDEKDDARSSYNIFEAEMVAQFFSYLVLNGLDPSQITVLTFYTGQRKKLIQELKRITNLNGYVGSFKVFTVDSYQGEENDVILLSLVRSNDNGDIGFLANKNRVIVALSRARRGLYIFGNMTTLLLRGLESGLIWKPVTRAISWSDPPRVNLEPATSGGAQVVTGIPIVCSRHGTEMMMTCASDFDGLAGGCRKPCKTRMLCGHVCVHLCHPFAHDMMICKEPCRETIPNCGHKCTGRCGDRCRCPCDIPVAVVPEKDDFEIQEGLESVLGGPSFECDRRLAGKQPQTSWKDYDPLLEDQMIEEKRRSEKSESPTKTPAYKETHLAVRIKNGNRVADLQAGGMRVVAPSEQIFEGGENLILLDDKETGKGKTALKENVMIETKEKMDVGEEDLISFD